MHLNTSFESKIKCGTGMTPSNAVYLCTSEYVSTTSNVCCESALRWREVAEPGAWGRHPTSPSSTFHLTLVANSPSNIQHLLRQTDICPSHGLQIDKWISLFTWIYVLIDRYRNLPFSFIFYLRVGTNRWAVGPI